MGALFLIFSAWLGSMQPDDQLRKVRKSNKNAHKCIEFKVF